MSYDLGASPLVMTRESISSRLVNGPLTPGSVVVGRTVDGSTWPGISSLLSATDELGACTDPNAMLRRAVELARSHLGLERVAIYLRDPSAERIVLRGTWGTGLHGETTDERGLYHELSAADHQQIRTVRPRGALWLYLNQSPHVVEAPGDESVVVGRGWLVITPLLVGHDLVGVMYNDAALTHSPVNEDQQVRAAIFCGLLAALVLSRRGTVAWQFLPGEAERSRLVQQVLYLLTKEPQVSGDRIAKEMGISAGHLARSFKAEMGVSLVEYRNRLRIERFFTALERGRGSLLEAALEAGFGSYAQFYRVYRKMLGTPPRQHLASRNGRDAASRLGRNHAGPR